MAKCAHGVPRLPQVLLEVHEELSNSYRKGIDEKLKFMAQPYKTKRLKKTEFDVDGIEIDGYFTKGNCCSSPTRPPLLLSNKATIGSLQQGHHCSFPTRQPLLLSNKATIAPFQQGNHWFSPTRQPLVLSNKATIGSLQRSNHWSSPTGEKHENRLKTGRVGASRTSPIPKCTGLWTLIFSLPQNFARTSKMKV